MTADHSDSLALYLNHYCKVPVSLSPLPPTGTLQITEITLDHMIVSHPNGRNVIQIDPPMKHFGEARERLVAMHKQCLTALDMAEFRVNKYVPPNKPWQWFTYGIVLLFFSTFSVYPAADFLPESNTLPSKIWSIGGLVPPMARLGAYIKNPVLFSTIAIHLSEVIYFDRTRTRKYWVPRWGGLWWMWQVSCFVGGVSCISRFDDMVRDIKAERQKGGKH